MNWYKRELGKFSVWIGANIQPDEEAVAMASDYNVLTCT